MSLPPTIPPDSDADRTLHEEILPPESTVSVSTRFVPGPDLRAPLTELGLQIAETLRIPNDDWPRDRQVSLSIDMVVVPSRIRATITNTPGNE